jgi:threonine/homoserine/homoserine lactone efflux protein
MAPRLSAAILARQSREPAPVPSFVPDLVYLLPFFAAALALNLTPGADMTYVMARSVAQGRPAGLASAFGVFGGSAIHTLLAAVGVSALLAASAIGFLALKYLGAAYLLYLAARAFLKREAPLGMTAPKPDRLGRVFLEGLLVNLFNPKVALFILAFLPQFVEPAKGAVWAQILFLGTCFNIGGTIVNVLVAIAAARLSDRLRRSVGLRQWMNRITGTILGALAIRLMLSSRQF